MSGGHFNYDQHRISGIADEIAEIIYKNNDESIDEYGDKKGRWYSDETISRFQDAINALKKAAIYAQRVDWLLSDDDGEEEFHKRLDEELQALELAECIIRGLEE